MNVLASPTPPSVIIPPAPKNIFESPAFYMPDSWEDKKRIIYSSVERDKPIEVYKNSVSGNYWERAGSTPRKELFFHRTLEDVVYTYGKAGFERSYTSKAISNGTRRIFDVVENITGTKFNALFANFYIDGREHLQWHADDGAQLDQTHPIAVFSFGAAREIWVKPKPDELARILHTAGPDFQFEPGMEVTKFLLEDKSLLMMPAGMQDDFLHRIPKSSLHDCGPRVSFTFRVMR